MLSPLSIPLPGHVPVPFVLVGLVCSFPPKSAFILAPSHSWLTADFGLLRAGQLARENSHLEMLVGLLAFKRLAILSGIWPGLSLAFPAAVPDLWHIDVSAAFFLRRSQQAATIPFCTWSSRIL